MELKMEFKWKDYRLNVGGLEMKTNYDPLRYYIDDWICYSNLYDRLIFRLNNLWVPDPFILHQRSLFSASIMKKSEALRVYPDKSMKYGILQNVRCLQYKILLLRPKNNLIQSWLSNALSPLPSWQPDLFTILDILRLHRGCCQVYMGQGGQAQA